MRQKIRHELPHCSVAHGLLVYVQEMVSIDWVPSFLYSLVVKCEKDLLR